ncbi:MAG: DUF488 domain-containing protein [Alphaproteobacteria bacterium]|nr:DUF488 domain-containing protein [Alphaproteobacteria bacterium]
MSVIFTIGYEGTDIDRFVRALKEDGVRQVADLRAVAVSRKAGFSKKRLDARLAAEGIRYRHFVSLGDPKLGREAARAGDFEAFRAIYGAHLSSASAQDGLLALVAAVRDTPTCLLCFERAPRTCHRAIVAQEVSRETGFRIQNLFAGVLERHERNIAGVQRHHPGESATAA